MLTLTLNRRYFDYGLNINDYLYDDSIIKKIRVERIKLRNPSHYSQFFVLESENTQYQYGSMFEPHVDPVENDGRRIHQFCLWHKNFVFFHTEDKQIKIVRPTLDPIEFLDIKPHGIIPRWYIPMLMKDSRIMSEICDPKMKINSKDNYKELIRKARILQRRVWWLNRTEFYDGQLIFIGRFI